MMRFDEEELAKRQLDLPAEAIGEDEFERPQPADEPITSVESRDLLQVMRHTIDRLESAICVYRVSSLSTPPKDHHLWIGSDKARSS